MSLYLSLMTIMIITHLCKDLQDIKFEGISFQLLLSIPWEAGKKAFESTRLVDEKTRAQSLSEPKVLQRQSQA